ncbi:unnamed protein product [Phytophthora lilii]|uniref:Unnamed protein product n=1 Tax=Phytophthora lilii TaxID=2077276 RepID=A0A9W6TMP3_9STRA|nr:unnamed protein product [Phytophthora lilii]
MFAPGADVLQESTIRPLIRPREAHEAYGLPRLSGCSRDSFRCFIITNPRTIVPRFAKFCFTSVIHAFLLEEVGKAATGVIGLSNSTDGQRALTAPSVLTAESFARKLQNIVCPPQAKGPEQSMRLLSGVETKRYVDARTLQRLVKVVSDGGLSLSRTEATTLLPDMTVDQFGLVRCGDILRVLKAWVQNRRREKPEALWEIIGNYVVDSVKHVEKQMNATLTAFVKRASKTLGPSARRRTTVAKERLLESLQNVDLKSDNDDGELQWSITVRVGANDVSVQLPTPSPALKRVGSSPSDNIRFRLGIHPPGDAGAKVKTKIKNDGQLEYDSDKSQPEETDSEAMCLILSLLLNTEITGKAHRLLAINVSFNAPAVLDEDGIDLASSVEKAMNQELVWASFASLWTKCSGALLTFFYLFFVLGDLDQSLLDIIKASQDMAALLNSLGKRQNRHRVMKIIFDTFDSDHSGEWSFQDFNTFQQALGKEALLEVTLAELFGGVKTISFDRFIATYENYSAANLLDMVCLLGIAELAQKFFSGASKLNFLQDPLFVASWVDRLHEFVQPAHAEHLKERPCRSIICSLEREISKTEQQLGFDDQSRKLPRGTSARRAEAMIPFLEMAKLVKTHVRGPELMEIRSKSIRVVLELDNLYITPQSFANQANQA